MTADGVTLRIRASVGAVAGTATDPEELLRLADARMYEAQRDSRLLSTADRSR